MTDRSGFARVSQIALIFGSLGWSTVANAQEAAPVGAESAVQNASPVESADSFGDDDNVIVVTGTSIRGVAPIGSEVISVGRGDIEESGSLTTSQLLLEIPQVYNSGVSESTRNGPGGSQNVTGSTAISLRGLGPTATLTLLDGNRTVANGTAGGYVDPSTIPTLALQRVEVVADGASAIYGSDAVAGVVNLILRRSYDGIGVDARYGVGADYHDWQAGVIAGQDWGTGRFTVAYQHSFKSALFGKDRDFNTGDLTPFGGDNFLTTRCSPGNILIGDTSYAIPREGAAPTNLQPNTINYCDPAKAGALLPQQTNDSVTATFDQDFGDKARLWLTGYYANREAVFFRPAASQDLTVPNTNAFFVAPQGTNPSSVLVQYQFTREFGEYVKGLGLSESYQIFGGMEFNISPAFNLTLQGSFGHNDENSRKGSLGGGGVDAAALAAALASNDPATALNPFGTSPNTSQAVIKALADTDFAIFGENELTTFGVKLDGELFHLPGGTVRYALGIDFNDIYLNTGTIRGGESDPVYFNRELTRQVTSEYGELYIPLIGPENATPGIQELELSLAGRISSYNDAGTSTNPKVGINWRPVKDLMIRGSYGTSFRAPSLTQSYAPAGGGLYFRNLSDPLANGGKGGITRGVVDFGDNPSLAPETATTWSIGLQYEPKIFRAARFSVNYFNVTYEGQVVNFLRDTTILQRADQYPGLIVRNPTPDILLPLLANDRAISDGTYDEVLATPVLIYGNYTNLGVTKTDGLDYQFALAFAAGDGTVTLSSNGTYYFNFDFASTPLAPLTERVGTIDNPTRFRNRTSLGYAVGGFNLMGRLNFSGGYTNTSTQPNEKVSSYTTVDLNLSYRFEEGPLDGLKLGLEAINVFDRDPPYVNIFNGGYGYDAQVANPIGRVVAFTISKKF